MRPVNLIPEEQRRARAGGRSGPFAYVVLGALLLVLAGVVVYVLSSNEISERETEIQRLGSQQVVAEERAQRLEPFIAFQQVERERLLTISQLANARFDWPRVLHQISYIVPKYMILTKMIGLAGGKLAEGGGTSRLAAKVEGPSLAFIGCAVNQRRVAALIAALKQIDGVTRTGLERSEVVGDAESGGGGGAGGGNCFPDNVEFELAVAFDAAPASPDVPGAAEAAPTEATSAEAAPEGSAEEAPEGSSEPAAETAPESQSASSGGGEPSGSASTEKTEKNANGATKTTTTTTTVNPPE
jgi:Tfp pilus assembly protein PilN